jgi:ABC-type nitrate/sulfonate/bicarbonate transport system permease component
MTGLEVVLAGVVCGTVIGVIVAFLIGICTR